MGFMGLRGGDSSVVICMGDNGAVVVNIVGGVICGKYFVDSVKGRAWEEVRECILENKRSYIYLVLDHSSQVYGMRELPPTCKLLPKSMWRNRQGGFVDVKGFKTSFFVVNAVENGQSFVRHMFVESRIENRLFEDVLNFVTQHSSLSFQGILLFSLELAYIAHGVATREGNIKKWVVFLAYTKVGDFRLIVLHNGKLFDATSIRVMQSESELPDVVAGKVYHSMQNAVSEISRIYGPISPGDIGLYMVVSGCVKSCLLSFDLKKEDINVFTPYELGKVLKIQDCVSVGSMCCDTVLLYEMMKKREFQYIMHTKKTFEMRRVSLLKKFAIVPTVFAIALLAVLCVYGGMSVLETKDKRLLLNDESAKLFERLESIRGDQEFARIREMYDVVDLYRSLTSVDRYPMVNLSVLSKMPRDGFEFTSFEWRVTEDFGVTIALGVSVKGGKIRNVAHKLGHVLEGFRVIEVAPVDVKTGNFIIRLERI